MKLGKEEKKKGGLFLDFIYFNLSSSQESCTCIPPPGAVSAAVVFSCLSMQLKDSSQVWLEIGLGFSSFHTSDLGCSRCSVAQRSNSSLVSLMLQSPIEHSPSPFQLSLVSVPVSWFSSSHFWRCSSVTLAFSSSSSFALACRFWCL